MIDLDRLAAEHVPNTPRTHDAHGRPVHEPVQCAKDLQAWRCDVRQLLDLVETLPQEGTPQGLRA